MSYVPEERAHIWKQRLSVVYMLVAWNAFGFVVYNIYKGNSDWARKYKSDAELSLTPGTKTPNYKIKHSFINLS
jgi:hypothetical protein